jgi:hypothetical protein
VTTAKIEPEAAKAGRSLMQRAASTGDVAIDLRSTALNREGQNARLN